MADNIKSLTTKLNKRLNKELGPDGCWTWTGSLAGKKYKENGGYGQIGFRENGIFKTIKTHRLAYEIKNGPIPSGMCVLHKCDNTRCCNPDHLFIGTQKQNIKDMVNKNRNIKGESHPMHKLTELEILKIRNSNDKTSKLSYLYSVDKSTIIRIRSKKTWRHI